jgi:hypothetical protein
MNIHKERFAMSEAPNGNNPSDLSALNAKIQGLQAALQETVRRVRRRNMINMAIMAVLLVATAIYLGVAYSQFSTIDPNLAASYARARIEERLPEVSAQMRTELKAAAPGVIAMGEARLRQVPTLATQEVRNQALAALDRHLPEIEEQMTRLAREEIRKSLSAHRNETNPDKRFALILSDLEKITAQHIEQAQLRYLDQGNEVLGYLETLAENRNLDARQQLQREMLRNFFVLMHERAP